MPRKREGNVYHRGGHWVIRVLLQDGKRSGPIHIDGDVDEKEAREIARDLAAKAARGEIVKVDAAPAYSTFEAIVPPVPYGLSCIYVVRDECFAKVGVTVDLAARFRTYIHHNPAVRFVASWPGARPEETEAIERASELAPLVRRRRNREWFEVTDDLIHWALAKGVRAGDWWRRRRHGTSA